MPTTEVVTPKLEVLPSEADISISGESFELSPGL